MPDLKYLAPLVQHIETQWDGDYSELASELHQAVYYLHFVEVDAIDKTEIRNTSVCLAALAQALKRVHKKRLRPMMGEAPENPPIA